MIETDARKLYYVLADQNAYEYRIGVGREGFNWTGTEKISRQQAWPDWYPPAEMRERDPKLPEKMMGGDKEPPGRHGPLPRQHTLPHPRHQRP